jgi:hypothetical protein
MLTAKSSLKETYFILLNKKSLHQLLYCLLISEITQKTYVRTGTCVHVIHLYFIEFNILVGKVNILKKYFANRVIPEISQQ